jgi:hypothetical protein
MVGTALIGAFFTFIGCGLLKQLIISHMPSFLDLRVHSFISSSVGSRSSSSSVRDNLFSIVDLQGGSDIRKYWYHTIA